MVGVRGFEPPTPASRTQYSTRLSYTPNCRCPAESGLPSMHLKPLMHLHTHRTDIAAYGISTASPSQPWRKFLAVGNENPPLSSVDRLQTSQG